MKKRAFLVSGGAVAGLAATVVVNPIAQSLTAPAIINTSTVAVTTKTTSAPASVKANTASAKVAAATSNSTRTITGSSVQERYGTVQVAITVTGKKITGIQVLQVPGGRNQQFADYAVPALTQEVLSAQSANVSMVSGASYISGGFLQSVATAIAKI